MPTVSSKFKLGYFIRGGEYSAQSEYQRFVTVDYNLESYVGVIGVGIIDGWEIQQTTDTEIKILPGRGIIGGFFAESPYVVKKRSDMINGDREVEVVKLQTASEPDMTDSQADIYISVIQLYNPSFNPEKPIEDSYVKVVVPEIITLNNNYDTYIWVTRKYSNYYPSLSDYPSYLIPEPTVNEFSVFDDYLVAKAAYDAQMDAIYSYQFVDDPNNHFTEVEFNTGTTFIPSTTKVLLGKVTTRENEVVSIDTSEVNTLKNLESTITKYANKIVTAHHHGGTENFDPARINLETDFRQAVLTSYNSESRRGNFNIVESQLTGTEEGHRHTFTIDSDNNGQTVGIIGTSDNHFHKIVNGVMQTQETTNGNVLDHIHSIPDISNFIWDDYSEYIVYVNNIPVGDNNSTNITVNSTNKTISLTGIIGGITKTYGVDFDFEGTRFQFSKQQSGVYKFMLDAIKEFNSTFSDVDINTNPFLFFDEETQSIAGITDLKNQSVTAESLLKDTGDTFVFTPNASRNIEVTLLNYQKTVGLEADKVTIEILGNSEVQGFIKPENIFFINAQKITSGVFEISQIPFISHVGRINEPSISINYPLVSNDGVSFSVTPSVTDISLDHYHNLLINNEDTGFTEKTFIDDDPVFYAIDTDGESYLVAHIHSVSNGIIGETESDGLLSWQNSINDTAEDNSSHTHNVLFPSIGDVKIVYSMFEDRFGNLYVGTSDNLVMVPNDDAFIFVINEIPFYEIGTDLLTMFESAKQNYELQTGIPLKITSDIYTVQIALAEDVLLLPGDSYLIVGKSELNSDSDTTMIQKLSYVPVPNYKSTEIKDLNEVGNNDVLIEVQLRSTDTNELLDPNNETVKSQIEDDPNSVKLVAKVEKYFDNIPATSIEIQEITKNGVTNDKILTVNGDIIATNTNLQNNFYFEWESPNTPSSVGVFRNAERDEEGNIWVASNNGVLVLRSYNQSTIFSKTTRPGETPDIKDILVYTSENIYCASDGIYKTEDQGKTWNKKLSGNFNQIIQDFASIQVLPSLSHTHILNVNINGNGTLELSSGHTHTVTNWIVSDASGHTHSLRLVLYAVSSTNVYRSKDDGETWTLIYTLPDGENGDLFVYNNISYLSKTDGIYTYSNGWNKLNDIIAYSFKVSYDLNSFYIGSINEIYEYSGSFSNIFSFSGTPLPTLTINGSNKVFGYSYNNRDQKFYINDITVTNQTISSLINFDRWFAENGGWNEDIKYDIFIDNKLILSTKTDVDNRLDRGWSFNVDSTTGLIDFSGEANVSNDVDVFDNFVEVDDISQFQTGDRISIRKVIIPTSTNEIVTNTEKTAIELAEEEAATILSKREIDSTYFYATITSVSNNIISFSPRSTIKITSPAKVFKIPNLDANSSIKINIYDSFLSNIGTNTHQEIEDKLSYSSDQRPYGLNNSYLTNLLQLTQAVRYVYPEINSEMVQSLFYDFHYSEDPSDPNYFGNYIDILNSESYSLISFKSPFESKGATSINKILIGTGTFINKIIVGTDIGVFWSISDLGLNTNWFYVWGLSRPIYDMRIFGGNNLLVSTDNGVYLTQDMITWDLQDQEAVRFPSFSMSLRWPEDSFTVISSHTAKFDNSVDDPTIGRILTTGGIYSNLEPNRSIKIETLSDPSNPKNETSHLILRVFPNYIEVNPSFEVEETIISVKLTVGSWWQKFDGENNVGNEELTNTLLVGGKNKIAYTPYLDDFIWTSSLFEDDIDNVNVTNFLPLSTGGILSGATGTDSNNVIHYIMKSSDLGKVWSSFKKFGEIRGTISSSKISTFGHSIISVNYTSPNDFRYADGELDKRKISIFSEDSSNSIFDGKVIFNDGFNSTIVIFGNDANRVISDNTDLSFKIYPVPVNRMIETNDNTVLFGTDIGIYYDKQTITGEFPFDGQVWSVGISGRVTNIDISGLIKSVSFNESNKVIISVESSNNISADQFQNGKCYVVDLPTVTDFLISKNSSRTIGGEVTIELDTEFSSVWLTYSGKNIKLVGDRSVLDVDFDFNVSNNQLANGSIYVSSNENNNSGKTYTIVSNSQTQIIVNESIIPYNSSNPDTTNDAIIPGQSFVGLDSSGKIPLSVTFTQDIVDNFLVDFDFKIMNSDSQASLVNGITVYQNSRNKVILNDFTSLIDSDSITDPIGLIIKENDIFRITGLIYQPLSSFNNKVTSTESSHYHELNLIGGFVNGLLLSFYEISSTTVRFTVSDTTLFDNIIVQQNGSLFKDARIRFYNPLQIGIEYFSEVISHDSTTITVKLLDNSNWDFNGYSQKNISETWKWEIDSTNYGYTKNIFYSDFVTSSNIVTEDISINDQFINVDDTSNMISNDKIMIISGSDKSETNFIKSIVDSTTIELEVVSSNSYFISNTVYIKVLRDEFSNTHEHMIRNNQVETISVDDYLNLGYPSKHSHKNTALIDVISDINKSEDGIIAVGSSSFVYNSSSNGSNWEKIVDLNDFVEGNLEVQGIVDVDTLSNNIVVGTSSGEIFSTGGGNSDILPLNKPKVN